MSLEFHHGLSREIVRSDPILQGSIRSTRHCSSCKTCAFHKMIYTNPSRELCCWYLAPQESYHKLMSPSLLQCAKKTRPPNPVHIYVCYIRRPVEAHTSYTYISQTPPSIQARALFFILTQRSTSARYVRRGDDALIQSQMLASPELSRIRQLKPFPCLLFLDLIPLLIRVILLVLLLAPIRP